MLSEQAIGWGFFLAYLVLVGGAALLGMRGARGLAGFSVGTARSARCWWAFRWRPT
ncbi:hypothetical protein [Rhodothermus marinus]|uniref:hypothetical protein n=1 Tax=Rhodothermus marinus TaxID=29549 RepID=UPI000ACE523F|nr:hypothetical protein [Rhodothermus marinus]